MVDFEDEVRDRLSGVHLGLEEYGVALLDLVVVGAGEQAD